MLIVSLLLLFDICNHRNLINAGIKVKMITGDHLNIAKETARLIGMHTNIQKGEETRVASQVRDELIWESDGFAQVLPRDKREVVLVLKNVFKQVCSSVSFSIDIILRISWIVCSACLAYIFQSFLWRICRYTRL